MSQVAHSSHFNQDRDPRSKRQIRDRNRDKRQKPGRQDSPLEEQLKEAKRTANEVGEILYYVLVDSRLKLLPLFHHHQVLSRNKGQKDTRRDSDAEFKRIDQLKRLCVKGEVELSAPLDFLRRIKSDAARRAILPAFLKEVVEQLHHSAGSKKACEYMAMNARQLAEHAAMIAAEKDPEELLRLTEPTIILELMQKVLLPPEKPVTESTFIVPQMTEPKTSAPATPEDYAVFN